jgi:predicted Na+-dependent transporter
LNYEQIPLPITTFINKYFSYLILGGSITGLLIPDPGKYTPFIILSLLFVIIFSSYFLFNLKWSIIRAELPRSLIFVALRYVILPVIIYLGLMSFSRFYAFGFAFLALMPAGVSSPAIGQMLGGNYNLSVMNLVVSNLVVIITVPLLTPLMGEGVADIHAADFFRTLFLTIILPFFLHLPLRRSRRLSDFIVRNLRLMVISCLSLVFMFVIAHTKAFLFSNTSKILPFLGYSLLFFALLYISGWYVPGIHAKEDKTSTSVSSGLNNVGIGVSLATLYISPMITVLFIMAEFAWSIALIPVKYWLKKRGHL